MYIFFTVDILIARNVGSFKCPKTPYKKTISHYVRVKEKEKLSCDSAINSVINAVLLLLMHVKMSAVNKVKKKGTTQIQNNGKNGYPISYV